MDFEESDDRESWSQEVWGPVRLSDLLDHGVARREREVRVRLIRCAVT
jgi:hypothetical protein